MIHTIHTAALALTLITGFASARADSTSPMEQLQQQAAASILSNGAAAMASMISEAQEGFRMDLHRQRKNSMQRLFAATNDSNNGINTTVKASCKTGVSAPKAAAIIADDSSTHGVIQ